MHELKFHLLLVTQGDELLRTEDILSIIEDQGDSIALVMFSGESKFIFSAKRGKVIFGDWLYAIHQSVHLSLSK